MQKQFGSIPAATGTVPAVDRRVPRTPGDALQRSSTDPEAQGWSVTVAHKRPVENERRSGLPPLAGAAAGDADAQRAASREMARKPDAPFLSAQAGWITSRTHVSSCPSSARASPEAPSRRGLRRSSSSRAAMQQFGFSAGGARSRPRRRARLLRARLQGEGTTESPRLAGELVRHSCEKEPIPGIEFEYRIASTFLPSVTPNDVTREAKKLITTTTAWSWSWRPRRKRRPFHRGELRDDDRRGAEKAPVEA